MLEIGRLGLPGKLVIRCEHRGKGIQDIDPGLLACAALA
jgi:hypothetical protein